MEEMGKVKAVDPRKWTEKNMQKAVEDVINKKMGVNEASRLYEIPSRTLRRHILMGWRSKQRIGRPSELGYENELKLVAHIKKLESIGFPLEPSRLQSIAYDFAENLRLPHRFNNEKKSAGWDWFQGFMKCHPDLSKRKAEGLSLARASGMNRQDVDKYFEMLLKVLTDNDLISKPERIYNMDESGIQVNNKTGRVIASKGAKCVNTVTSTEKGENVSLIACCNAEGTFLPPILILKGKYKKPEFCEGLPPGSNVYMNQKSSYINAELFLKWMKEHFIPRKQDGKVLLILDGHSSHSNSYEMLQLASENDVIILCLPSHTTQALQPLDRSFFKPFKSYLSKEVSTWFINNKGRPFNRYHISKMIGDAWFKSAIPAIGVSGFKATGICPYDPNAVPEYFFRISDASMGSIQNNDDSQAINNHSQPTQNTIALSLPSTSTSLISNNNNQAIQMSTSESSETAQELTPSKTLQIISPLPIIQQKEKKRKKTVVRDLSSSSESEVELQLSESSEECSDENENTCVECHENYYRTKKKSEWIRCLQCSGWLHEDCTSYREKCNNCGTKEKGKGKGKRTSK
ncbi:uncharacterized protein LOC130450623 [Diorhabda sublineata]|uniref:uncharacterized protein LOC130450623 n=1 Tax=Diorhabda sublineata TaxID=1163346 RepID=UPI0024E0491D|nr:uncharacterized protein LOC130450623 [Diorhabda sublineata]